MVAEKKTGPQQSLDPARLEQLLELNRRRRPPRATYRLQFHAGFTLRDAAAIVPYLAELGISHLYASPLFQAVPGSQHGYDIVDFTNLNPEIGTRSEFDQLCSCLQSRDMGLMLDFVPNHMGIGGGRNRWWQDVLENGQTSACIDYFDIDWEPLKPELGNKVLLPILGDHYGVVLESGELQLRFDAGAFTVWYHETPLPIAPPSYPVLLNRVLERVVDLDSDDPDRMELQSIAATYGRMPGQDERELDLIAERRLEQAVSRRRLAALVNSSSVIRAAIEETVAILNGVRGDAASFDELDALLEMQSYRLAFWRVAAEEINYRRFFAINELAAMRQEVPEVFDATHSLLLELIGAGQVEAVRIDHPDGLWDPAGYFRNLQRAAFVARYLGESGSNGDDPDLRRQVAAWWDTAFDANPGDPGLRAVYLVVEKIVEHGEELPADWVIDGTVGYEFASDVTGLLVDRRAEKAFDRISSGFTERTDSFEDLAYQKKKLMLRIALTSEFSVLARVLDRITEHQRRTRDFTLNSLRDALRETIACFPIYRTYIRAGEPVSDRDQWAIRFAIAEAKRRNPYPDVSIFDFIESVLLDERPAEVSGQELEDRVRFRMRFQQLTSPVMAKGVEDTTYYLYNRLAALNEVGGRPDTFGSPVRDIHRQIEERAAAWPHMLLTSSTHDTKRSEDVRARIAVLSEAPREWRAALNRWSRLNRRFRIRTGNGPAPDRNDEYLLYQTLIGTWPLPPGKITDSYRERIVNYMEKASREAQVRTNWTNPNQEYDDALRSFVGAILDPGQSTEFLADIARMVDVWWSAGLTNALAQQAIKLSAPGVPDLYQGTDLWDFSLVDPDNRRPVDFATRTESLGTFSERAPDLQLWADLWANRHDGRVKQYLTHRLLRYRVDQPELLADADYRRIRVSGSGSGHVFAFVRTLGERQLLVVAPRLTTQLQVAIDRAGFDESTWGTTALHPGRNVLGGAYVNLLTGERFRLEARRAQPVGPLLANAVIAVLAREETE